MTGGDAPFNFDPPQHCDFRNTAIEKHGFFVDGETYLYDLDLFRHNQADCESGIHRVTNVIFVECLCEPHWRIRPSNSRSSGVFETLRTSQLEEPLSIIRIEGVMPTIETESNIDEWEPM